MANAISKWGRERRPLKEGGACLTVSAPPAATAFMSSVRGGFGNPARSATVGTAYAPRPITTPARRPDAAGNQASTTLGVGGPAPATTYTQYDGLNQLLNETDADGNITSSTYAAAGVLEK